MNTIALTLAVACAVASIGLASWVWMALDAVADDGRGPAGLDTTSRWTTPAAPLV